MTLEAFVERRLMVADRLAQGECGGHYVDACIILSGMVSAIASYLWPGDERGDRRRFIETWMRFSALGEARRISVPILNATLRQQGHLKEADALERARPRMFGPGYDVRVLRGEEVDLEEDELVREFPTIELAMIRRHSYAAIFYKHVRSKLVHEGELNDKAASHFATSLPDAHVSYVNEGDLWSGEEGTFPKVHRRVHFHMPWLIELTRTMARNADAECARNAPPLPEPGQWWILG
jgi:hypothetical protein